MSVAQEETHEGAVPSQQGEETVTAKTTETTEVPVTEPPTTGEAPPKQPPEDVSNWEKFHQSRLTEKMERGLRVMVGVDGSEASKRAVYEAISLVRNPEDKLYLVQYLYDEAPQDQVQHAQENLSQLQLLLENVKPPIPPSSYETKLVRGKTDIRAGLCKCVDDLGVDVLVVGSRGLGPLTRLLMGSVSSYLVSNAPCPVLVVKELPQEKKQREELAKTKKAQTKKEKQRKTKKKREMLSRKKKAKDKDLQPTTATKDEPSSAMPQTTPISTEPSLT